MKNQKGFTVLEGLLILIIIGIIGGTGWYVWQSQKKTNDALGSASKSSAVLNTPTKLKEYKNDEYGFSFQYPSNWELATKLVDGRGGYKEGDVIATSPNGTKVDFGPNQGGKGGDCLDEEAGDTYTTRTCVTRNILSLEKLPSSTNSQPVYFYHASWTDPTDSGGKTHYYIYIGSSEFTPTKTGPEIGAFLENWDLVSIIRVGAINISVSGRDDSKNNSTAFFDTQEVKEATSVLKSFKLL